MFFKLLSHRWRSLQTSDFIRSPLRPFRISYRHVSFEARFPVGFSQTESKGKSCETTGMGGWEQKNLRNESYTKMATEPEHVQLDRRLMIREVDRVSMKAKSCHFAQPCATQQWRDLSGKDHKMCV